MMNIYLMHSKTFRWRLRPKLVILITSYDITTKQRQLQNTLYKKHSAFTGFAPAWKSFYTCMLPTYQPTLAKCSFTNSDIKVHYAPFLIIMHTESQVFSTHKKWTETFYT